MATVATDLRQGINSGAAVKVPCRVATTASITLSGLQTIDGVSLAAEDRVLVKNQSDTTQNGIYSVGTGTWTRAFDFDGTFDVKKGTLIHVHSGTVNASIWFTISTADPITIGTSAITFTATQLNDQLAALLSASSGSSLVGFLQSGTGATDRTVQAKLRDSVSIFDFGATGDGIADDTAELQAAIDAVYTAGGGNVLLHRGTFKISSTINLKRGVALVGSGQINKEGETGDAIPTKIVWAGSSAGTMFNGGNRWQGRLENIHFDGAFTADTILNLGGPSGSVFRNLIIEKTRDGGSSSAVIIDMTGQTYDAGGQYPSASMNMFDTVIWRNIKRTALYMSGVASGATTLAAVTLNTFINCYWNCATAVAQSAIVLNQCCDTNNFYGGIIQTGSGASTGVVMNFSTTNNETFGNNFFGTSFVVVDASGLAIDARNNLTHNFLYGCYMPQAGSLYVLTNGANAGKLKVTGCTYATLNSSFKSLVTPSVGASPWTYTNTTAELQEFRHIPSGTTTAISFVRNSSSVSVGAISSAAPMTFFLEPTDALTITYSTTGSAPVAQVIPH